MFVDVLPKTHQPNTQQSSSKMPKDRLRCDLMNWRYRSRSSLNRNKRSASANHAIKCSLGDVEHAAINTATTQQLDLEEIDVSGEFEARLWIRSDGLAFVS
jgi:hypothetical protein